MVNLRYFWTLCLLCIAQFVNSQKIISSNTDEFDSQNDKIEFIAKRYNYYYFLKAKNTDFIVEVYDSTLKKVSAINLDFLNKDYPNFLMLSNTSGFNTYYVDQISKVNKTGLFKTTLNDYLKSQQKPKVIDTFADDLTIFKMIHSTNNKFFSAIFKKKLRRREFSYLIKCYNENGTLIKTSELPELDLAYSEVILANSGDLYIAENKEEAKPVKIAIIPAEDSVLNWLSINPNMLSITNIDLKQNSENEGIDYLIRTNSKSETGNIQVHFLFGVLNGSKINNNQILSIDEVPELKKLISNGTSYKLKYMNSLKNGGLFIALEEYKETLQTIMINSGFNRGASYTRVQKTFEYGDIHLIAINNDNKILWSTDIPKYQKTIDDNGITSSFGIINQGYCFTVYFNSLEENLNTILKGYKVFPTGDKKELFFTWLNATKNVLFISSFGTQITSSESILPIFIKNQAGIAKISI